MIDLVPIAEPGDIDPPNPPTIGLDTEPEPPDPIDFAEFDLRAREWWDRFATFVMYQLPVTAVEIGSQLAYRDQMSDSLARAEDRALIACLDAMTAMAKRYNPTPEPTFTIDVRRIGRG